MFSKFCKKIIPLFLAFIIFISSVVPVSAAENSLSDYIYYASTDSDFSNLSSCLSRFYSYKSDGFLCSGIGPGSHSYNYIVCNFSKLYFLSTDSAFYFCEFSPSSSKYFLSSEMSGTMANKTYDQLSPESSFRNSTFIRTFVFPKSNINDFYVFGGMLSSYSSLNFDFDQISSISSFSSDWQQSGSFYRYPTNFFIISKSFASTFYSFDPVFDNSDKTNNPVPLGIDVEGFTEFYKLTVNGYIDNLNKYFGDSFLKIDTSTIGYLVGYYNAYGSSDKNFSNINYMPDLQPIFKDGFFIHTPVGNIPLPSCFIRYSDYKKYMDVLRVRLQSDYQAYLRMKSMLIPDVTPVIKDNSDLIVDVDTDTIEITLLREIIRLLANISNNLTVNFSAVVNGLNAIANLLANINFNINPDIDVDIDPSVLGINNMVGVMNNLVGALNNLIVTLPSLFDNINISANVPDEDFLTWLFVPTFDEFDEIYLETVDKFPVLQEISTLPDTELDDVLGLPVNDNSQIDQQNLFNTYGAYKPPEDQPELPFLNDSEYNYSYSESDITSKDLFTFTVPDGQSNDLLKSVEGQTISIVNFKKFSKAIAFFKGVISVLAVYAFCKWLLQYVPKIVTGSATGD